MAGNASVLLADAGNEDSWSVLGHWDDIYLAYRACDVLRMRAGHGSDRNLICAPFTYT